METVYFSKWMMLESGELITNGAISINGKTITAIGPRSKVRRNSTDRVVNLGDVLVLPGLINMHTHLEECIIRGITRNADETFATWSIKKDARVRQSSAESIQSSMKLCIRELLAEGITTVVDFSRRTLSSTILSDESIRIKLIYELHNEDQLERSGIEFLKGKLNSPELPHIDGAGPYSLYSFSNDTHHFLKQEITTKNLLWAMHLGESADEIQAFTETSGDLYFHNTRKRPWPFDKDPLGPINLALKSDIIPDNGILVHCNYVNGNELEQIASKNISIVHCHSYTELIGHKMFPVDAARKRNVSICLGTEGIAPAGFMSLFDELFSLKCAYPHIPAKELLSWVTINPAKALQMGDLLGSLTPGKYADIIAVRFAYNPQEDPLEELIMEEPEIAMVMVDGEEVISNY